MATGGSGSGYTWCVQSASGCVQSGPPLPDGFTLSSEGTCGDGCVNVSLSSTGSPPAFAGFYNFTVQVTDSAGNLATRALTLVISCPASVTPSVREASASSPTGASMFAQYTVPSGLTLPTAAAACGFEGFNWQQTMTNLPCGNTYFPLDPLAVPNNLCSNGALKAPPNLNDPAPGGYFVVQNNLTTYTSPDASPYYYPLTTVLNEEAKPSGNNCVSDITCVYYNKLTGAFVPLVNNDDNVLSYYDDPSGDWTTSTPAGTAVSNPPICCYIGFTTALVGVDQNGNPVSPPLWSQSWTTTFNGTSGGIHQLAGLNANPVDPGSGTGGIALTTTTPTMTVTPGLYSITTAQTLNMAVVVNAVSINQIPTGSVTLTGSYAAGPTALSGGSAAITIPAGWLAVGTATLTASYTPDAASSSTYNSASGTASVTVTTPPATATVLVTPSSLSITTAQSLTVGVSVSGASGSATLTGAVTLSSGSYTSPAVILSGGTATIDVPAGSLATGTDTLTVNYTPDNASSWLYGPASGSASVAVNSSTTPLTITASSPTMTYGGAVPTITATYTYGSVTNSSTPPSGLTGLSCSTTATSSSPVGSYPSSCSGAVDASYTISYTPGSVSVGPAPLVITAASATMTYGGTVPAITASYSGFVNGDSAANLAPGPTCPRRPPAPARRVRTPAVARERRTRTTASAMRRGVSRWVRRPWSSPQAVGR